MYKIAQARFKIGQMSRVDLLQMQNSRLTAESSLTDAQMSLDSRTFQLRSFLGFGENTVLVPTIPDSISDEVPLLNYQQVLDLALENNSFTQNIQRRMLEASENVSQAKADRWDIKLFASVGWAGYGNKFAKAFDNHNWGPNQIVSLGLSVPILDWGKRKGKVRVAESNQQVVNSQIEKEKLDFMQNIFLCVQNFNHQPKQLQLAKEVDSIARSRYNTTVEAFIQGKMDILNLNDSQTSKDSARRNYIEQMYLLWSYYYQIRGLTLFDFIANRPLEAQYPI